MAATRSQDSKQGQPSQAAAPSNPSATPARDSGDASPTTAGDASPGAGKDASPEQAGSGGDVAAASPRTSAPIPTLEEYVAAGYPAETYEKRMAEYRAELAAKGAPPPKELEAVPAPINGADDGAQGGPPPAPPEPVQAPKPGTYAVAPGKAVSTMRGVVTSGGELAAKDFHQGEVDLEYLVTVGAVIKG
jgi:hypothetical protein